ncbi:MAG: translesion DNA synthesis-associated protein ImuA [Acidiferrobacterales bacterium]
MNLQDLMLGTEVWRAGAASAFAPGVPSGFPQLDALLPGGGWPPGMLTEILVPSPGIGELQLLLPALARLSRGNRWLAFIAPPHIPYAPALAAAQVDLSRVLLVHPRAATDGLWAVEQSLRAGTCSAVLAWPSTSDARALRRLQLAAEAGGSWGVLFRSGQSADAGSPAALRLRLAPTSGGIDVHILKRRGGWPVGPVSLDLRLDHAVAVPASAGSRA